MVTPTQRGDLTLAPADVRIRSRWGLCDWLELLCTDVARGDSPACGPAAGERRSLAAREGAPALNALMGQLYGVQPTPTHSDYVTAAQDLLRRQRKRALVIISTNFRDEDSTELRDALRLLRSRHLVLLSSLRERIVGELMAQPLMSGDAAMDIASAHL